MIGKPHWQKPPPPPIPDYRLPFESEERKQALRRAWIAEFGHDRCSYCGTTLGCVGEGRNIVPACRTCNTRKGAKTGAEFRAKLASERR